MRCYYHNDLDGRAAAAVVFRKAGFCKDVSTCEFIEVDYNSKIEIEKIGSNERVIIVDFSFKPEIMEQILKRTENVTWIDHHRTAFEYKYSKELIGFRDAGYSGCELAWQYFVAETCPRALKLIGDRDTWKWKYGAETAEFCQGMRVREHGPKEELWEDLFEGNRLIAPIRSEGRICLKFRDFFCRDYADQYGFETEFEGHKCFAVGLYDFGSDAFGERFKKYEICLSFEFDGENWVVGLYSEKVDVSKIAVKYGGGGHPGAAGFVCKRLPFQKN